MCDPAYFNTLLRIREDGFQEVEDEHGGGSSDSGGSDGDNADAIIIARKSAVKKLKVTKEVVLAREELYNWRHEHATARFGAGLVATHGSHLLMPDSMIDRIITCAQVAKLPDLNSLIVETGWRQDLAEKYGMSLLTVVHTRYPHQNAPVPRKKKANENSVPSTNTASRVMHCSVCGGERHNRRSNLCPMKQKSSNPAVNPAKSSLHQAPAVLSPPISRPSFLAAPPSISQPSDSTVPSSYNSSSNTLPPFYQMLLQRPLLYPQFPSYDPMQRPL
ncbi:hypothetical protein M378DRAFT_173577 [Amanita muscaria Koide BX008]|nr:hypothetical protein M378DRAFT_173577 [Amanita muscaria Koide BX008]